MKEKYRSGKISCPAVGANQAAAKACKQLSTASFRKSCIFISICLNFFIYFLESLAALGFLPFCYAMCVMLPMSLCRLPD